MFAILLAGMTVSGTPGIDESDPVRPLSRALDRLTALTVPAEVRPAAVTAGPGADHLDPGTIVTGPVRLFAATADETGRVWVAAVLPENRLRVLRSDDLGASWEALFEFQPETALRQVEVVTGPGDSAFAYVFYLTAEQDGTLRALRVDRDGDVLDMAVAVGSDTITAFAVAADRDDEYYLYCLYVNEHRGGRNGAFTRSLDYGKSWELTQSWWNCREPYLIYGSGSTIHAAWQYAGSKQEIHIQTSRYLGRPLLWWGHRGFKRPVYRCAEPVIAQLDTSNDARALVVVAWTEADRNDLRRNIAFTSSDNGGAGWFAPAIPAGEPWLDRWAPMLAAAPGRPFGPVQFGNVAGQVGADTALTRPGKTGIRWRTTTAARPTNWSASAGAGIGPVASGRGLNPRMVIPTGVERGRPLFIYSRRSATGASGLYADAGNLPPATPALARPSGRSRPATVFVFGNSFHLAQTPGLPARVEIFDASGRRIGPPVNLTSADGRVELESALPAGPAFLRVTGPTGTETMRLMVIE